MTKTLFPNVSIVIPTYNSERTLKKTLLSIKKQTYPQKFVETIIVDGGSKDKTLEIAREYKCIIINNPKTDLVYGKHLGFINAKGKYLLNIDSDEVLENKQSLKLKVKVFQKNINIKAVLSSGYKTPKNSASINDYINEFGDPFSYFMYRESKYFILFIKELSKRYKKVHNDQLCTVFDFSLYKRLPLIELWAGGSMVDLSYVRKNFPRISKNPSYIAHLFYLIISKGKLIGVTKNDPTVHNSVTYTSFYLKKIVSRVRNNVFENDMGGSGFKGRQKYTTSAFNFKKYLFVIYSLTIFPSFFDSMYLTITRKNTIYLLHTALSLYTAVQIIYFYFLKYLFRSKPTTKTYGE